MCLSTLQVKFSPSYVTTKSDTIKANSTAQSRLVEGSFYDVDFRHNDIFCCSTQIHTVIAVLEWRRTKTISFTNWAQFLSITRCFSSFTLHPFFSRLFVVCAQGCSSAFIIFYCQSLCCSARSASSWWSVVTCEGFFQLFLYFPHHSHL